MQFQIPQFIDTEDKIAGPLTLKQLLYVMGAGILIFATYWIFAAWLWFFIAMTAGITAVALAFVKYNGQPLQKILISGLGFVLKPRLYLWKREAIESVLEDKVLTDRRSLSNFNFGMPAVKKLWSDLITTKNPLPKREKSISFSAPKEDFSIFRKLTGEREAAKRVDYR